MTQRWDDIYFIEMAFALEMGQTPSAYWKMSCGEFLALIQAKNMRVKEQGAQHKDTMRMLRLIGTYIYNSAAQKQGDQKRPEQLIPFKDEELPEERLIDPAVLREEAKKYKPLVRKSRG